MERRRRGALVVAAAALVLGVFGVASCSLGLDESLIGQNGDDGHDGEPPDTFAPEGGDGTLPPIHPEGGVCAKDEDCNVTPGCLAAKCDLPRKACVFQVCREAACTSGACGGDNKCQAGKPYTFRAANFPVAGPAGATIGCGGALSRCFAVVYPYVFVGTTNGVIALSASNPASTAPAQVPIKGLGFVPAQIIASGSRVYFLGGVAGAGTGSRLALAYADVPPNPFATTIDVTTVLATYTRPATDTATLFPRGNDTALLVDTTVASAYASFPIEPPLAEPAVFASNGITFTVGAQPLAVSGSRLLMGQINAAGAPIFGFVDAAGSSTPQTGADVTIATATPAAAPGFLAQSADGAIFWAHVSLTTPPAGPPPGPQIRAARGYFLVGDSAGALDPAAGIDLEVYGAAAVGTASVGPVAMLDSKTALVTTAIPANPAQTNVQFVRRTPLEIVKNADNVTPRRFQILLPVTQLAAAGSNGLGYVLAVDPTAPAAPTVYVFDPACAP